MKVSEEIIEVNAKNILNISVDVASKKLDFYFEVQNSHTRKTYREVVPNRSIAISEFLKECHSLALSFGFDNNQNNNQFGFGFNPQQTAAKPEKEVDWSQIYNF